MNKILLGTIAALSIIQTSAVFACTSDGKEGIFPENNLYIPASRFATYTTNEEEFNAAVDKARKIYEPVFAALGREYKIVADWKDGTVNAYAKRSGKVSEVYMFGGLARHAKVTADGFMLVICHETGHHLGGAPRKGTSWASNEGQSDYFATLKCAREVWKDEDNAGIISKMDVPAIVTERCQKAFNSNEDIAICKRATMGGKSLADTLGDLGRTGDTDLTKVDPKVVTTMDDNHPAAQCRMDTYFAGAVCNKSKDIAPSNTDPTVGTCSQERGEVLGIRPLCWYLPMGKDPTPPAPTPPSSGWPSVGMHRQASK